MTNSILPSNVFNLEKTNYSNTPIILGESMGMFDTINKQYPDIWTLFKTLRAQDWDAAEFDYSICNAQFKSCDKSIYDMMIKTLAWQWETDSIFATKVIQVLSNVCTSSEAWAGWLRICDNEQLHSEAYSEIVRNSFDNPSDILDEILNISEAHERLVTLSTVFQKALVESQKYSLGLRPNDQELYNTIYLFIVALLCGERIQFMASFAITFGLADSTGLFQPAAKAIQKICQDEFEVHVQFGKAVLAHLHQTEKGRTAYEQTRPEVIKLIEEVTTSELSWSEYLFSEGRELTGITKEMIQNWSKYGATDVAQFMGINEDELSFNFINANPLKYMESWIDMSKMQASPQEEDPANYKVGLTQRDDEGVDFDFDL